MRLAQARTRQASLRARAGSSSGCSMRLGEAMIVLTIHTNGLTMSRTTSVTIGSQLNEFVQKLIESGRYSSSSEVVRSALRLLERQENQTAALRHAVEAGERSGESDLSLHDVAARVKQKHHV